MEDRAALARLESHPDFIAVPREEIAQANAQLAEIERDERDLQDGLTEAEQKQQTLARRGQALEQKRSALLDPALIKDTRADYDQLQREQADNDLLIGNLRDALAQTTRRKSEAKAALEQARQQFATALYQRQQQKLVEQASGALRECYALAQHSGLRLAGVGEFARMLFQDVTPPDAEESARIAQAYADSV